MGPVEHADLAVAGHAAVDPPQEVVGQLLGRGHLERRHRAALRVERGHDVAHRAVLARGVDPLEDDEHLPPALRPEPVLEMRSAVQPRGELVAAAVLGVAVGRRRVDLREVDALAGTDAEGIAEVDG